MADEEVKRSSGRSAGTLPVRSFYRQELLNGEVVDLEAALAEGLEDEITMLRIFVRRVMALSKGLVDLDEAINVLGALGLASTRLASLLKAQKLLAGDRSSRVADALSQALSEVVKEMSLKNERG